MYFSFIDFRNFSLDLNTDSITLHDSKEVSEIRRKKKKNGPPPLPARKKKKRNRKKEAKGYWPPKADVMRIKPPREASNGRGLSFIHPKSEIEVVAYSDVSHFLLPPPEPLKPNKSKVSQKVAAEQEESIMSIEDWRSHVVRLELAELEILRDIDRFELRLKEADSKLSQIKQQQPANSVRRTPHVRKMLRETSAATRLVDSYRFSVRSPSLAPYSVSVKEAQSPLLH